MSVCLCLCVCACVSSQIYSMREAHDELSHLLRKEEAASLGCQEVFAPFVNINSLQVRVLVCVCIV